MQYIQNNEEQYEESQQSQKSLVERRIQRLQQLNIPYDSLANIKQYENYKMLYDYKITEEDKQNIIKFFQNHYVFYNLSDLELQLIIQTLFCCEVEKDDYIIKQGDFASSFFILKEGKIQIYVDGIPTNIINPGQGIGELALLYNSKRTASCKAIQKCKFWGINRLQFKNIVEQISNQNLENNYKFIQKIQFLQNLNEDQKFSLAGVLMTQKFKKGDYIVKENELASSFYLIQSGQVKCVKNGQEIRKFKEYDTFGECGLLNGDQWRSSSIIADSENVVMLAIGKTSVDLILGDSILMSIYFNIMKLTIEKMEGFDLINPLLLNKILQSINIVCTQNICHTLQVENVQIQEQIIVCISGHIYGQKTGNIVLKKFQGIGSKEMIQNSNETFQENLIVDQNSVYIILQKKNLYMMFGQKNFAQAIEFNIGQNLIQDTQQEINQIKQLQISDLESLKQMGEGQFGSVHLVRNKKNKKQFFGLKIIQKNKIMQMKLEKHIQAELNALNNLKHNQLIFPKPCQDKYNVYFLLEFIEGVELFDAIREIGLLGTLDSQFYISQLILALEYIHSNNYIYRDLKPENVMVDCQGYLKLIDFGTIKKNDRFQRSYTIIGTPHYMAPEIITGKGYTKFVDAWALGVCFYEFMCGSVPFGEETQDPMEVYKEIIQKQIQFPDFLIDLNAINLILLLLSKIPEHRLQGGEFTFIKNHIWFSKFDWDKLQSKQLTPPYVPPKMDILKDDQQNNVQGLNIFSAIEKELGEKQQIPNNQKFLLNFENQF